MNYFRRHICAFKGVFFKVNTQNWNIFRGCLNFRYLLGMPDSSDIF